MVWHPKFFFLELVFLGQLHQGFVQFRVLLLFQGNLKSGSLAVKLGVFFEGRLEIGFFDVCGVDETQDCHVEEVLELFTLGMLFEIVCQKMDLELNFLQPLQQFRVFGHKILPDFLLIRIELPLLFLRNAQFWLFHGFFALLYAFFNLV